MFTLDDFWKIFKHIYNNRTNGDDSDDDLEIDKNIKAIALSEFSKSTKLFENTLDQISFSSSDYRKLRKFLINWYASFRTLVKLQNESLDIFSMTEENLDELFRSFGFNYSYSIRDFETKVNFFLDLVNIYKIKGTPTALRRVLSYYGMSNVVLLEYHLQFDQDKNLLFKPSPVSSPSELIGLELNLSPLFFEDLTRLDPHWFQTKDEILKLFESNKINLPSKTPYFGVRPIYEFKSIEPVLAYFRRIIYDNIKEFKDNGTVQDRDVYIDKVNLNVSITELYLSCIYCFNVANGYSNSGDSRYIINNTDITDDYDTFKDEYEKILFDDIESREKINDRISNYNDKLTKPIDDFYLSGRDDAFDILEQMNPDFLDEIDVWETSGRLDELIPYLISSLNTWLEENIDTSFPDFTILTLGFDGLLDTKNIINFFKPKRSRFLTLDVLYSFNSRSFDSLKVESKSTDFNIFEVASEFNVFNRPDQDSSCSVPHQEMIYDCGYLFDAGIVDESRELELKLYFENQDDRVDPYDDSELELTQDPIDSTADTIIYVYDDSELELTQDPIDSTADTIIYVYDDSELELTEDIESESESLKDENCEFTMDYYSNDEVPGNTIQTIGLTNNFHHFDNDNFTFDERGRCYQESVDILVEEA